MTKVIDLDSAMPIPDLREAAIASGNAACVQCAHILPFALANFDENRDLEVTIFVPSVL
jgi:hypothetical protein